jgi:hypothetical protein
VISGSDWWPRQMSTSYPSHLLLMAIGRDHSPIAILVGIAEACSRSCIVTPRCSAQRESVNKKRSFTADGQAVIWIEENRDPR